MGMLCTITHVHVAKNSLPTHTHTLTYVQRKCANVVVLGIFEAALPVYGMTHVQGKLGEKPCLCTTAKCQNVHVHIPPTL